MKKISKLKEVTQTINTDRGSSIKYKRKKNGIYKNTHQPGGGGVRL